LFSLIKMSKRTDTNEAAQFQGTLTVVASDNPIDYGGGNIELEGALFTDIIRENTDALGVDLEGINFTDNYFTMTPITAPSNPPSGKQRVYVDTTDNLLKSRNDTGIVTVYQPLTTKGDLLTHNGTTQVALPVGASGYVLTSNPASSTGLEWVVNNASSNSVVKNTFTLNDSASYIIDKVYGSWYACIAPLCLNGASCIFFTSKNIHTSNGSHIYRMCNNNSLISIDDLSLAWQAYKSVKIDKNYSEGKGDYLNNSNKDFNYTVVTLTVTSWVSLGTEYNVTTGAFFVSVYSDNNGPCATFVICKSDSTLNSGSIFVISSSNGSFGTSLNFRWLAASGLQISKSNINNNGDYNVINNFQNITSTTITLSGTSIVTLPKTFFNFYESKTFVIRIYSNAVANSPKSIIFVSKNTNGVSAPQTSNRSPGKTTLERIFLSWESNSLVKINKDGPNYDGVYIVDITSF
jgi:hypothetical protein